MTLFLWARPMRPRNHSPHRTLAGREGRQGRSGAMDQERAQVGIASFGDPEKARPAAALALTGHEPQPGSEIARPAEGLARADRRDERRRVESAEARDGGEPPRRLVLPGSRHELGRERRDATVELGPFQAHILDEETG